MRLAHSLLGSAILTLLSACTNDPQPGSTIGGGGNGNSGGSGAGSPGTGGGGNAGRGNNPMPGIGGFISFDDAGGCRRVTCAELGWACGYTVDMCGNVVDCEDEGLKCGDNQVCVGGIDGPTQCQQSAEANCPLTPPPALITVYCWPCW